MININALSYKTAAVLVGILLKNVINTFIKYSLRNCFN